MFSECSPSSNLYSVFAESFLLTQVPFRALLRNWESLLWLIIRMHFHMWWYSLNPYKMPVINDMFMKATRLFDSDYYGYINSDILVTPNLFQFIELCRLNAEEGNINKRVSVIEWMNGRMKSQEEFTTSWLPSLEIENTSFLYDRIQEVGKTIEAVTPISFGCEWEEMNSLVGLLHLLQILQLFRTSSCCDRENKDWQLSDVDSSPTSNDRRRSSLLWW